MRTAPREAPGGGDSYGPPKSTVHHDNKYPNPTVHYDNMVPKPTVHHHNMVPIGLMVPLIPPQFTERRKPLAKIPARKSARKKIYFFF